MVLNHLGKVMIGFKTTPFELLHPVMKEFGGPSLRRIGPEMVKRFFQQVGFEKPAVDTEQDIERLSGFATHMSPSGQKNKLFPHETSSKAPRRLMQFLFTDIIEGFEKMLDHVKLVIDDLRCRALGKDTVSKGFPHIDDPMGDPLSTILSKPLPKLRQMPLFSAFSNEQKLRPPGSLQGTHHVPISLPLPHCNLIDTENRNAIQGSRGLYCFPGKFIDGLYCPPMQGLKNPYRLDGHDFTQF